MIKPPAFPPIIGVSGQSNSGKTLLIERMVPLLRERGARVAVVKHCTHHIEADTPGKDSDRIFKAGANVLAAGPSESFARFHGENVSLWKAVRRVAAGCDVCLVEGYRGHAIPRIQVLPPEHGRADNEAGVPVEEACGAGYPTRDVEQTRSAGNPAREAADDILFTVTDALTQVEDVEKLVWDLVERSHRARPVMGLILPDAANSSEARGVEDMKRIADALAPHVERVLVSGEVCVGQRKDTSRLEGHALSWPGLEKNADATERVPPVGPHAAIPPGRPRLHYLPPVPDARMPLAGILSAMRWNPAARWVVIRGDAPGVESRTVKELLSQVRVGMDAVLPQAENPLAVYEPTCLPRFEEAAMEGIGLPVEALADDRVAQRGNVKRKGRSGSATNGAGQPPPSCRQVE